MKARAKGSITIFATLSIMLIAAFLFVLLEGARTVKLREIAEINTASVLESVFAGYENTLWETYHLLAFDGFGTEETPFLLLSAQTEALSNENLEPVALGNGGSSHNLLQMRVTETTFSAYRYLTDDQGKAFEAATSSYMKNGTLPELAQLLYGEYEAVADLMEEDTGSESAIAEAAAALEDNSADGTVLESGENPLAVADSMARTGILDLVIRDPSGVSRSAINLQGTVSHRTLNTGTCSSEVDVNWLDFVLMQQYLTTYMGDYTNVKENRALSYELEYLLCGKGSDIENLKSTVNRLLLLRESCNLAYLATDLEKQGEALALATSMAGITANPAIVEAVQWGILASWAYAESVMDVRTLLDGGKIPLIKNAYLWTSDVQGLVKGISSFGMAKSSDTGLTYSSYVGLLLFCKGEQTLALRGMDLIEATVQKQEENNSFRLDRMVIDAKLCMTYEYRTIFLGMESLTEGKDGCHLISDTASYSYRRAGA
jgi:hypothetical protein